MRRVSEVIDCWYDAGAMPFAQWGYQGQSSGPERERFLSQFPADFISEAIDQTRGWFYSQLAISTLLFGPRLESDGQPAEADDDHSLATPSTPFPHPFRNCIVLGLMLGEDGQKMSKSKRNYLAPDEIFDQYGADALRWYFFSNQPPWTSIRYSEQSIKESVPEFLLRLWNVVSFFTIYANIDGFDPAAELGRSADLAPSEETLKITSQTWARAATYRAPAERGELDRWILSELSRTANSVVKQMDTYDNYGACQQLTQFVDALSNWYVRRSRDRFWSSDKRSPAKLDAYWTLYECLTTSAQMIAPFVPFAAESMWQDLVVQPLAAGAGPAPAESVHLCDYPTGDPNVVDEQLSIRAGLVRHIASLGRQARATSQLKVRQPLSRVEVILVDPTHRDWLEGQKSLIAEELNVKEVNFCDEPDKFVQHEAVPNFKLLGPKLGKLMPKIKQALNKQSCNDLLANFRDNGRVNLTIDGTEVELVEGEVEFRLHARAGWSAANDRGVVVVLATELTEELRAEGIARDLVRAVQDQRKETGCDFTDRIEVGIDSKSPELAKALELFEDYISKETLATELTVEPIAGVSPIELTLGAIELALYLRVAP
jgi:isoleucyl-tRNA synthetase